MKPITSKPLRKHLTKDEKKANREFFLTELQRQKEAGIVPSDASYISLTGLEKKGKK